MQGHATSLSGLSLSRSVIPSERTSNVCVLELCHLRLAQLHTRHSWPVSHTISRHSTHSSCFTDIQSLFRANSLSLPGHATPRRRRRVQRLRRIGTMVDMFVGATSNSAVMSSISNLKTECLCSVLRETWRSPHFLSPGTAPDELRERSPTRSIYRLSVSRATLSDVPFASMSDVGTVSLNAAGVRFIQLSSDRKG